MIRPATPEDIPALVDMGRKFHAASQMPMGFDPQAVEAFLGQLIPQGGVFIGPRGAIGGALAPAYCDPAWVMAVELFWWAEGGGMGLLRAFEAWAVESGAREVRMTSLAALERADRLLRLVGYSPVEISYQKVLAWQ